MPELPPMPRRIAALRLNPAGYPVPWFVDDGTPDPDFRLVAPGKIVTAIKSSRCWVCGGQLGRHRSFVLGPMCAVNRTTSEPPGHHDCSTWSARACPFLTNPAKRRRMTGLPDERHAPGVMIERNPGVALVWTSTHPPTPFDDGDGGLLFRIGPADHVEWWCEGRTATRDEVMASITSGLPLLREAAERQAAQGALDHLHRLVDAALELVPT